MFVFQGSTVFRKKEKTAGHAIYLRECELSGHDVSVQITKTHPVSKHLATDTCLVEVNVSPANAWN